MRFSILQCISSSKVEDQYFLETIFPLHRSHFTTLFLDSENLARNVTALALSRGLMTIDSNNLPRYQINKFRFYEGIFLAALPDDIHLLGNLFGTFAKAMESVTLHNPSTLFVESGLLPSLLSANSPLKILAFRSEATNVDFSESPALFSRLAQLKHLQHLTLTTSMDFVCSLPRTPTDSPIPSLTSLTLHNVVLDDEGCTWSSITSLPLLVNLELSISTTAELNVNLFKPDFVDPERHDFPQLQSLLLSASPNFIAQLFPAFRRSPLTKLRIRLIDNDSDFMFFPPTLAAINVFDQINIKLSYLSVTSLSPKWDIVADSFVKAAKSRWPSVTARVRFSAGWSTDGWSCDGEDRLSAILGVTSFVNCLKKSAVSDEDYKKVWALEDQVVGPLRTFPARNI